VRPPVSVVVPFLGDDLDAFRLLKGLRQLRMDPTDELVVADNTARGVMITTAGADRPLRVVHAASQRSSYHARNAGARAARGRWLLFMDADCTPVPGLLDRYFAAPIPDDCAAVAGQILGEPVQRSLAARYARSRRLFDHAGGLIKAECGGAGAANLLVRRRAFDQAGGFAEGIRSGGDLDLCRRLEALGWRLEFRPAALVHHRHRETLPSLLGAFARYGAGARWLNERYPGSSPPWPLLRGLVGSALDVATLAARGRVEPAIFRALDGAGLIAHRVGYLAGNEA
jgi:cellulose synthase/poly-beta-1,6-N-acetylglucosamine synthase-like glycosyltransferase